MEIFHLKDLNDVEANNVRLNFQSFAALEIFDCDKLDINTAWKNMRENKKVSAKESMIL
jgi:hypothetical protein